MINDVAKLMNEIHTVTGILSPEIDEVKLMHRFEEILSNYDIKKKSTEDVENDATEKIEMFLSGKQLEGLSQLTLEGYLMELTMFYNHVDKPTVQITTSDIRSYLASNKEWQVGTIDKKLSVLKSYFSWLVQEELLIKNPVSKIKAPKKPKRLPKALTIEELEIVRESCETNRERALVEVMFSTGCRLSEIANMKISDIDFHERSAKVIGKGDKERTVYFSFKAMHHLNKYLNTRKEPLKKNNNYLFIGLRRPFNKLTNRSIERIVDKIESRSNLSKSLTPHVFRHTAATVMMDNGADLVDVQHILGHENPSTTLVYASVSEERKKTAHRRFLAQ